MVLPAPDTRAQMHHLAQVGDWFGRTHAAPRPDFDHTNWRVQGRTWHTARAATADVHLALEAATLRISVIQDDRTIGTTEAAGRSLEAVRAGLDRLLHEAGLQATLRPTTGVALPAHPVGRGAPFAIPPAEARALADLYAEAGALLETLRRDHRDAGPARLWPHHFDLAILRTLEPPSAPGGEDGRTVGIGLSPGDATSDDPYWYVTPWPRPAPHGLPSLADGGRWQTEGWIGALRPWRAKDPDAEAWLRETIATVERIVPSSPA